MNEASRIPIGRIPIGKMGRKPQQYINAALIIFAVITMLSIDNYASAIEVSGEPFTGGAAKRVSVDASQALKSAQDASNLVFITLAAPGSQKGSSSSNIGSPAEKIGFSRSIERMSEAQQFQSTAQWSSLQSGGVAARMVFTSPGALALRVGMHVGARLPDNVEFRYFTYDPDGSHIIEAVVNGEKINELIDANAAAGDSSYDSKIYWSPLVSGDRAGIEIYLPEGTNLGSLKVSFPKLSHLFAQWDQLLNRKDFVAQAANACQNDATCYSDWLNARNAVARMVFTTPNGTYTCTGTLLNDSVADTFVPYFATANHCISTQSVASTLQTRWFEESSSCNGSTRNSSFATRLGGATLLYTKGADNGGDSTLNQDFTLLRLNDSPPAGAYFLGWNTDINLGNLTGIHHPASDWKKLSRGINDGMWNCYSIGETSFYCDAIAFGNFVRVNWTDGGVEGGSSGSGLFLSNDQLLGVLLGSGGGSCAGSISFYSEFGAAYRAGHLARWLNSASTPQIAPDLVVVSPFVDDASLVLGQAFTTSATTRNIGSGISNSTTLRFYISPDSTITTSDTQMSTDPVSGLDIAVSEYDSDSNLAPNTPGTYWVGACVDPVNDESNTANNCSEGVRIVVSLVPGSPDTFEPDDSSATASTITKSVMQHHSFHVVGDKDWVKFTLPEDVDGFTIETSSSGFLGDTRLYLYDESLTQIEFDDDSGAGSYSRIRLGSLPAGSYFVLVDEFGNDNTLDGYNLKMFYNSGDLLDFLPAIVEAARVKAKVLD